MRIHQLRQGSGTLTESTVTTHAIVLLIKARAFQKIGFVRGHGRLLPPSKGVTDDAVGETHWVVKNGIRFSGMPSFGTKLSETELWQVSRLLHNADKLPQSVQDALRGNR